MKRIQKRNGDIVAFDIKKIEVAINKAANAVSFKDFNGGKQLSEKVESILDETFTNTIPTVEDIQDVVETVLMEENFHKIAKAYILYRKKRTDIRENVNNLLIDGKSLIENYINLKNWRVNENANMGFSLQGLNNHIVETVTKKYWLDEVYDKEIRDAHINGDLHIHDLGLLAPYCCGWDLEAILNEGFRGVMGKVESKPPKHFQSFLGQIVNFLYTLQGEAAGAQAISSLDTYAAPFIYYDKLNYNEVKKIIKSFVFNLNIPTRVGFQTPFTNITLDITPHKLLKNAPVHIDNEYLDKNYGDFQKEMDMFNTAFCEVMMEGDGAGRNFSFPIPTINITDDFPWESPVVKQIMKMTGKYGTPYFANFINSDLLPEDIRSMCCRLRLDNKILRKRGGGLFGANPLTGSINVVTLNMSRIGYLSKDNMDFKKRVEKLCEIAKKTCEIKRTVLENYMEIGLYPYSAFYLKNVKNTTGKYFKNHFSTIGVNGMNEACINFMGKDITSYAGKNFAIEILEYINDILLKFQDETGNLWNLEASPAEGAAYRFARIDKKFFPNIFTQGEQEPYYTNSTQIPVNHTDDIFEALKLQEELQTKYTGGTVFHGFLGEEIKDPEITAILIKKVFEKSKIPYLTITPTYSVCSEHGYISGEHFNCPICDKEAEVWSRVVGFHRPVQSWNKGKKSEFKDRLEFDIDKNFSHKKDLDKSNEY